DADPLLAAALSQDVELRSVQELPEHLGDLVAHDPRAVVGDRQAEAVLGQLFDDDTDLRQETGLLAGVERVVDRLLGRRQKRLGRIVEAEEMAVLLEKLGDRDLALPPADRLGGLAPAGRSGGRLRGGDRRGGLRDLSLRGRTFLRGTFRSGGWGACLTGVGL